MKDVDEPHTSDPIDPLHSFSLLSLFPQTFRHSMNPPNPNHPDDLESIHAFMKSMVLTSPGKYSEQAKAILDGNSQLLNSNFGSFAASEKENETVAAKGKENFQEQRPALERKQAQFSSKLNLSQSSLDIDQLQDPEEYFLAHERLENAKKIFQRQRGEIVTDLDDYKLSKTERRRRPGILGKSVSYKHRYSVLPESDNTFVSSQETMGQDILSPRNYISQPETTDTNAELREKESTGSIHKTEKRVNGLLDELLSDNCGNLDGDEMVSFLQERLQIKPLDLDKLCLPEFHDVGKIDFTELGRNLQKPRKTLSDKRDLGKGISGKTPVKHKQVAESAVHSPASPTPPRSPFASLSLLIKRTSKSNMMSNPFSALNQSPVRNSSSVEHVDEQSDQYNAMKELGVSGELKSLITEISVVRVDGAGSQEMITGDSIPPFEKSVNDNSSRLSVGINVMSSGSHGDLKDNDGNWNMDDNDSRLNIDKDVPENGPNEMEEDDSILNTVSDIRARAPNELEENVGDIPQEAGSHGDVNFGDSSRPHTDFQTDGPTEMEKNLQVEDMPPNAEPDINIEDPSTGNLDSNQNQEDQSSPAAGRPHAMDGPSETADSFPDQHIENVQEPSRVSLNEQSAAKRSPPRGHKRRTLSHRQSLAGAGTFWESGVRRSKRIKMRPLEYWKGERFLYGRIHESLTTVIGVKYVSPAKGNEKPAVRVKSYVSDEYKELVELAALH
ncbi:centromere protein C isoform X5 [Camellia sinensis]|uniref:centromere protein C isoform X5 n=1 Tax=Camellia sinensis TaxID=4442 RepID=UPI001036D65E|nr:centromere protein C isoform X5 [Camellia sinensis]